jgi:multidrug efflux pump subunit AcrA (membrane-fusion protein)
MDDRPRVLDNQPTGDETQNSRPQNSRPVEATQTLPTRRDGFQPDVITEKGLAIQALKEGGKPWAWWIVGAVVIALVVLVGFRFLGDPVATDEPEPGPVATSEIQVRDLTESQEYTGQLQYDDAIPVAASGSGYLTGLVGDGETIERGAVVYRLSNDPGEAELLTAQQQVASAESQVASASQQSSALSAGPGAAELSSAQASLAQAQLSLQNLTAPASQAEMTAAQAQLGQAEAAYADLFDGLSSSESSALQGEVTRAGQSYDQAITGRDLAWITLLTAQASYCGLPSVPVDGLCALGDLPLTDSDISALTVAVQTSLAAEPATVQVIQAFITGSNSYDVAVVAVDNAAAAWANAQANLDAAAAAPAQADIDQALAAVYLAQDNLNLLVAGPSALEVTQAEANLASAEARLEELLEGATAAERRQAAAAVETAKISLEISRLQLADLVAAPTAVSLFYGEEISWRTLAMGSSPGSDIRQLEENLAALGFDPDGAMVVDDMFDEATEQAVMLWEESLGSTVDGSVSASDLVYSPGPVKAGAAGEGIKLGMAVNSGAMLVDLVAVSKVGIDPTGSESVESTQKIVLQLPVDDRDLIEDGSPVVVELADGTELDAVVSAMGAPVTGESGSTVEVVVVPVEPIDDAWTGTNVTVHVTSDLAEQVLTVPVSALLALVEGGYAVEVIDAGDSTRLVAVETGMFADGVVEISGEGLSAGLAVVVPE